MHAEKHGIWRKDVYTLKSKDKATFFSPSEVWSLPAPSSKKLEEREFVVDSGASMHMLSRKDLSSVEWKLFQSPGPPTSVVTMEKVQTYEEAQVYVHDLDLFVTVQLLEDTRAVPSLGKLYEEHEFFH